MICYCGICYHDRGLLVKLIGPFITRKQEVVYHCPFCESERHYPRGSNSRVSLVPMKTEAEATVAYIPHIVREIDGKITPANL